MVPAIIVPTTIVPGAHPVRPWVSDVGGAAVISPAAILEEGSGRRIQLADQDITHADAKLQQTQQMMRVT